MNPGHRTTRIVDAIGDAELEIIARLFQSYADEFADMIAEQLCRQGFAAEVAGLPGRYAPPSGCLLLAMEGDVPAGCVGLRDLGDGTCEMKRLYVTPAHRGRGTGRLLVEEVIHRAETLGYRRMVLDTLSEMTGALALYRGYGFVETAPDWNHASDHAVFMQKRFCIDGSSSQHALASRSTLE
jgi:ribosomal protein S18 acetylase RimI-like enzyme